MNPQQIFCPNIDCPAIGQQGKGNIGVHSAKGNRYICIAAALTVHCWTPTELLTFKVLTATLNPTDSTRQAVKTDVCTGGKVVLMMSRLTAAVPRGLPHHLGHNLIYRYAGCRSHSHKQS